MLRGGLSTVWLDAGQHKAADRVTLRNAPFATALLTLTHGYERMHTIRSVRISHAMVHSSFYALEFQLVGRSTDMCCQGSHHGC